MMQGNDLELLKDIPGYKAILKALIKSQMQHLVEQLCSNTDEEAVLLAVSTSDGSLSHLGSESGKVFLDSHEDIKSKFLGFCLKRQHTAQMKEQETVQEQAPTKRSHHSDLSRRPSYSPYPSPNTSAYIKNRMKHRTSSPADTQTISQGSTQSRPSISHTSQSATNTGMELTTDTEMLQGDTKQTSDESLSSHTDTANTDDISVNESGQTEVSDFSAPVKIKCEPGVNEELVVTGVDHGSGQSEGEGANTAEWSTTSENYMQNAVDEKIMNKFHHVSRMRAFESSKQNSNVTSDDISGPMHTYTVINQTSHSTDHPTSDPSTTTALGSQKDLSLLTLTLPCKTIACEFCGKLFQSRALLVIHHRVHTGERPYACSICFRAFSQSSSYFRHMRMVHKEDVRKQNM